MTANRIMLLGEKETFLIKVLSKKISDANIDQIFAGLDVNAINSAWEGTTLVTMYLDNGVRPSSKVLRFLQDRMLEEGTMMILVGEDDDVNYVKDNFPNELLYKVFLRPLDNTEYINIVKDMFMKVATGEFKKSILVVDDDPNYLSLVREWLKDTYKVSMVNSGLQAIKWLAKNKADLILLDHEMPVTSGPQVLEMLRADEETKKIPVIFLTGKSDKESVMAVVALKPEGYFLKTIERKELLEKLEVFFKARK